MLELPINIDAVKGFLSAEEGETLFDCAANGASKAPFLEIGSYCGKSTVYLGLGCQRAGRALFALDHHRGSEEHQPGELFHDPELTDEGGDVDTLRSFRATVSEAGLDDTVIPILSESSRFSRTWSGPLSGVFIDGGHSLEAALADYRGWVGFIEAKGLLAIHDVYPKSEDGGQAPITVYRMALASGLFREYRAMHSLRVLQKIA